ncbi:DUF5329 domain-containing protein [Ferrimonas balearica]|uniref:DUF5329 domain-containing protein n=1 Tax=Ferrimonas balearica TaxID=44012 RepID=UPI001C9987B1|nr:DUF5329 domain-containing protein [Ferrimonas balearica]MBY5991443.1 DUF5329 domain-containing protein [Ferrimonas balearica]
MTRTLLLLAAIFAWPVSANASVTAEQEIQHLLNAVADSPCTFIRNGKSYDGEDARSHLERKYNYILGKGHELTAEQFIEHAGTQSSWSGRNYQIQCPDSPAEPSADWLLRALAAYRQAQ